MKYLVFFFLFFFSFVVSAQDTKIIDIDKALKSSLYSKYKKEVLAYDKKGFDGLFFGYLESINNSKILTKEEYYTFTIKIAIYSEKYGMLYKKEKAQADKTKEEWFGKMYIDYLKSKKK